jgi:hypothetical protein
MSGTPFQHVIVLDRRRATGLQQSVDLSGVVFEQIGMVTEERRGGGRSEQQEGDVVVVKFGRSAAAAAAALSGDKVSKLVETTDAVLVGGVCGKKLRR